MDGTAFDVSFLIQIPSRTTGSLCGASFNMMQVTAAAQMFFKIYYPIQSQLLSR